MQINIALNTLQKFRTQKSLNKVLPANKIEKNTLIHKSALTLSKQINEFPHRKNPPSPLIDTSTKTKSYLRTLSDKIFSPGDFVAGKNESTRNQKLILQLSKKLLSSSSPFSPPHLNTNNYNNKNNISNIKINPFLTFLPQKSIQNSNKKTLILDLDETLVHSGLKPFYFKSDIIFDMVFEQKEQKIFVLKRPYVDEFLLKMSNIYEIVIFTASIEDYANSLLDKLDPQRRISFRLFRQHCTPSNGFYIKDLKRIGRNLKDTIIIDNNPLSYFLNKDNGVPILTWHSIQTDNELEKLVPLLEYLAKVDDVREVIKKIISGNIVNFHRVNKIINASSNKKAENNTKVEKEEKNMTTSLNLFSYECNGNSRNNGNSNSNSNSNGSGSKEQDKEKKKSKYDFSLKGNDINLNAIKLQLNKYYFDSHDKKPTEQIKLNLQLNFDSAIAKQNNLLEDKKYQEKYQQFYEIKTPLFVDSNNFYDKAYEKDYRENLVLPSNYCHSSTKNLRKGTAQRFFTSSALSRNESRSNFALIDRDAANYTYRQLSNNKKSFDKQIKKRSLSISKALEKSKFRGNDSNSGRSHFIDLKLKHITPTATISLHNKNKFLIL